MNQLEPLYSLPITVHKLIDFKQTALISFNLYYPHSKIKATIQKQPCMQQLTNAEEKVNGASGN
jgi:hypothetical protein